MQGKTDAAEWQGRRSRKGSLGNGSHTRGLQLTPSQYPGWGGRAQDEMLTERPQETSLFPPWKVRQGTTTDTTVCHGHHCVPQTDTTVCQRHHKPGSYLLASECTSHVKIIYILFCSLTICKVLVSLFYSFSLYYKMYKDSDNERVW